MKRIIYLMTAVALLWGCDRNQEQFLPEENEGENTAIEIGELPEVLYASMAGEQDDAETRTYWDDTKVLWQNGDAISYFAGNTHNVKYAYNGEDGAASVKLVMDEEVKGATGSLLLKSQAVYPYNKDITVAYDAEAGVDKITLTYPTTQKYGVNSFGKEANIMVAAGENNNDANLHFRNACGYLIIKLWGLGTNGQSTTIKDITLSSVSGVDKIAGKAVVVADKDKAPVITMADDASTAVTLDCNINEVGVALGKDAENATEFWFCLPPVTFTDGIKITVTDVYGNSYTKQTSKTVNIERNNIVSMAPLQFVSNAPTATKLWYTRSDSSNEPLEFYVDDEDAFNAPIINHEWDSTLKQIVIEFGAPLTTIQNEAFRDTNIATITLPEGVTTIGEGAFRDSTLREITIPGSMLDIKVDAFWECTELESVTFLPNVTNTPLNICNMQTGSVDWGTFCDSRLTYINLNRELNYVNRNGNKFTPNSEDDGLFYHENYENVENTTVIIGPQVKTLSYKMFLHLPIEKITIPGTVTTIENNVFEDCWKLKLLTFEPSVDGTPLTMGYDDDGDDDGPFVDSPLTTVDLNREIIYTFGGSTPNDDNEGLFGNRTSLTSVTLGEQVKELTPHMFAGAAFTELVIPGTINNIGNNVFANCSQLATITFEPSATGADLTMGFFDASDDDGPFYSCPLTTIDLNRNIIYTFGGYDIDEDDEGLFGDKKNLSSVTLGEQVKTLSPHMFAGSGITSLDLNKVETIQNNALAGLALTSLTIPGSVNTIGNDVFYQCTSLAEVTFEPSATGTPLTMGYDTYGEAENLFQDNNALTTLVLNREIIQTQTGVDSNSEGLFGGMSTLSSITLGEQVKTLSDFMFAGSSIKELVIPGTVTTIANDVFCGCKSLSTIVFERSATAEKLTIGFDTVNIDESPFVDCPLVSVDINRELDYTLEPIDVDYEGLFGGKESLTQVTLGDDVKTLLPHMFAGTGITAIDLNKVEKIDKYALARTSLEALTIPGGVKTIGNNVFDDCTALEELEFKPHTKGEALTIGHNYYLSPFVDAPLTTLKLDRDINYTFNDIDEAAQGLFGGKKDLVNLTIGEQVKTLSPYMFAGSGLTTINLNKVETIKDRALSRLALTSLTIPGSVKTIGNNVFEECTALKELTFNPNDKGEALKIGFYYAIDDKGPFYDCPLTTINLNRELDYDFDGATPDDAAEGVFGGKAELATVTLGSQVKTLSPFMFAESAITALDLNQVESIGKNALAKADFTDLTIPATTSFIDDNAFLDCDKLANLTFAANESKELTIGFQPGTDERGPFWQSPLAFINLDRELVMNEDYAANCNEWDEGIFSNKYYDNEALTAQIYLGNNVHTILPYMFSTLRMEQLHLPKSIDKIGEKDKNVVERCNRLNAIVFYDDEVRPVVADNAFGNKETLQNYNYFLFMPRYSVDVSENGKSLYYTHGLDELSYWHTLCDVMVASGHQYIHPPHVSKGDGIYVQRYYDTENNKAKPGYEWYVARYCGDYDENTYVDITPPVAPTE